jgi:hypothetical protein
MRILLLEESFVFCPSSQCILVCVIPSCFHLAYTCLHQMSPVKVLLKILYIFFLRKVYVIYMDWWAGFSSCGECDMDQLGFISFYAQIL